MTMRHMLLILFRRRFGVVGLAKVGNMGLLHISHVPSVASHMPQYSNKPVGSG